MTNETITCIHNFEYSHQEIDQYKGMDIVITKTTDVMVCTKCAEIRREP